MEQQEYTIDLCGDVLLFMVCACFILYNHLYINPVPKKLKVATKFNLILKILVSEYTKAVCSWPLSVTVYLVEIF